MCDRYVFDNLFDVIEHRKQQLPDKSYVAKLLVGGSEAINAKIREEAEELCQACLEDDKQHLVHEICDLLFHTFVLAGHKDVTLNDIRSELKRRFGTGGLEEKANREKGK